MHLVSMLNGVPNVAILLMMVAAVLVVMSVLRTRQPHQRSARRCDQCRMACPPHANFCPNCGNRIANV